MQLRKGSNILKPKLFSWKEDAVFFRYIVFRFQSYNMKSPALKSTYHQVNVPMREENIC